MVVLFHKIRISSIKIETKTPFNVLYDVIYTTHALFLKIFKVIHSIVRKKKIKIYVVIHSSSLETGSLN